MNMTAIAIVAIVCWAIVELVNGPKGKKKEKKNDEKIHAANELQREVPLRARPVAHGALDQGERGALLAPQYGGLCGRRVHA